MEGPTDGVMYSKKKRSFVCLFVRSFLLFFLNDCDYLERNTKMIIILTSNHETMCLLSNDEFRVFCAAMNDPG